MKNNKIWCSHLKYWSRSACEVDGMDIDACDGWSYKYGFGIVQTDKWKYCPICGVERPTKLTKKQQAIETYHKNCAEGGTY